MTSMQPIRIFTVVAAATASLAAITTTSHAAFAGRNGRLVYQSQVGAHVQLFTVRPDGTDVRQITHWKDGDAINAAWSPNGRRIAYVLNGSGHQRVYVTNADGTHTRSLEPKLRGTVAWLNDKTLLTERGLRFVLVDVSTSRESAAGIPGFPGDSPCALGAGGRIAEVVSRSNGDTAIFVALIHGGPGSLRRITDWGSHSDKVDCSPDGSAVLFSSPNPEATGSSNVFTVRADGSQLHQLTHAHGGIDDAGEAWSPDGREIAFESNETGMFQIYLMTVHGTAAHRITRGSEPHLAAWGSSSGVGSYHQ